MGLEGGESSLLALLANSINPDCLPPLRIPEFLNLFFLRLSDGVWPAFNEFALRNE